MRVLITACLLVLATTADAAEVTLSPESRKALALAVYGDGYALVWDSRSAPLAVGSNRVAFEGVSRQMLPSSAMIQADHGVQLVDIDYDFALLTPDALLRRSLGKVVGVVRTHPTTGEETVENATLLSVAVGPVLTYRDRIESIDPARLVFYDMPADLRPRPTLLATVASGEAGGKDLTLGYQTRGLGWTADYVALWNEDAEQLDLTGRATLSNTTGADFPQTEVSLVAGSVNRESQPMPPPVPLTRAELAPTMAETKPMPVRQEFADLHLYKVPGKVSLVDQQTKQVTLLPTARLSVDREYVSEAGIATYRASGEPRPTHPQVRLRFPNASSDGADRPLPAGVVRVYAAVADGTPWLLGEDRIDHTPAGATVTLNPGEAFDITVLRRQTDFVTTGLPEGTSESAWAIEVKNARDKPAMVKLVEVVPGDWTILAESSPHEKETADRLAWQLSVPAKGAAQLTYRIRVKQ
jgi:hypothetical protein